jgi:hypothetical protein
VSSLTKRLAGERQKEFATFSTIKIKTNGVFQLYQTENVLSPVGLYLFVSAL